jgi:hypothetical protein
MISLSVRRAVATAAVLATTTALVPSAPVWAEPSQPSVTVLNPVADSTIPLGDVPVKVAVDLGGETAGHLDVSIGYYVTGSAEIPEGTCETGCEITVTLTIGDWDHSDLGAPLLTAKLTTASGAVAYGGGTIYLSGPPEISDLQLIRDGALYSDGVVADAATFRVTMSTEPGDSVAEVRLVDNSNVVHAVKSAPFSVPRGIAHDAMIDLDLTAVPDGIYGLQTRARGTDGYYGAGKSMPVRVTHANPAIFDTGVDAPQVLGYAGVAGSLKVQGPLLNGSKPGVARLSVDGVERSIVLTPAWAAFNWQDPAAKQTVAFGMQGAELGLGSHQVTLRLLDTAGRPIGAPTERTIVVSDFRGTVTAPKLVVGRRSTVGISADAPAGLSLDSCEVGLSGPGGAQTQSLGWWCQSPIASLRTSAAVTPRLAGQNQFGLYLRAGGYSKNIPQTATVYAARRAAVTAPAVKYGSRGTAKVTVQDSRSLNTWSAAAAGIVVTLQRQAVGSTTWSTVGSVKTTTGGVAWIPFTSSVNGRFRAVLASSVPGETTISPTIAAISTAAVTWRSAPTYVTRSKSATYQVAAAPYDAGAVAQLQIRKAGSTVWTTVRNVAVPSTTVTNLTYAFPTAGTWYVRVLRATTTRHAAGVSSQVTVKVV